MGKQKTEPREPVKARHGDGSLTFRGNQWFLRVTMEGGSRRELKTGIFGRENKELAEKQAELMRARRKAEVDNWDQRDATIADGETWILANYDRKGFKTKKNAAGRLKNWICAPEGYFRRTQKLREITADMVEKFIAWHQRPIRQTPKDGKPWDFVASKRTVNLSLDLLIKMFNMGIERGAVAKKPMIEKFTERKHSNKARITPGELHSLHKYWTEYEA